MIHVYHLRCETPIFPTHAAAVIINPATTHPSEEAEGSAVRTQSPHPQALFTLVNALIVGFFSFSHRDLEQRPSEEQDSKRRSRRACDQPIMHYL